MAGGRNGSGRACQSQQRYVCSRSSLRSLYLGIRRSFIQDGKPLPGVAQVAMQQGQYVVSVIADRVAGIPHQRLFAMLIKEIWPPWDASMASSRLANFALAGLLGWVMWLCPASLVPDWLSQPPGGRVPMAGVLDDVPTWCAAHHFWGRDT